MIDRKPGSGRQDFVAEPLGEVSVPRLYAYYRALGPLGRRGQGYAIDSLVEQLASVLGLERDWRIAIVGFGYLGHAFLTHRPSLE